MKKYAGFLSILSLVTLMFAGCENFLSGSNIQDEIQEMLDYQYADSINIKFDINNNQGTAKTSTEQKKKPTDKFTISFIPDDKYSFLGWDVEWTDKDGKTGSERYSTEVKRPEGDDLFEYIETTVEQTSAGGVGLCTITGKIRKDSELLKINVKPGLEERPTILSATPVYDPTFVSRENPIRIKFSQVLDETNFIFSVQELINEGVLSNDSTPNDIHVSEDYELLKDKDGRCYGYKDLKTSFVYFKNIEITTDSGVVSIADSFVQPELGFDEGEEDHSVLTIATDPEHLIEIGNAGFRTVGVKLSKNIKNEHGIELLDDYSWGYQVSSAALERAAIIFECEEGQGELDDSLDTKVARKYNKGQQIALNFTEDADYQFIRWDFDPRYVTIPNYKKAAASARVIEKTDDNSATVIKAVCVPRLQVEFARPEQDENDDTTVFPKDSTVNIRFNRNIPADTEDDLAQIDNISLAIGGVSVKNCFEDPVEKNNISGNQITYYADPLNRIQVSEGQTKTVTISIPADFYYIYNYKGEVFHITLGREYVKNYKINHKTVESAQVTFVSTDADAGTLSPLGFKEFQMGDSQAIKFDVKEGYQFEGWTITSNDVAVDENKIKISPLDSPNATLYVYEKVTGVQVKANVSQVLKVMNCTISGANEGTREDPKNKDASVVITFNQPLELASREFKLSDISITADGLTCTNSYNIGINSENTQVTITNEKRLTVNEGETKNISIKIPKTFYYKKDGKKIYLPQDVTIDFFVDHKTSQKAAVNYKIVERDLAYNTEGVPDYDHPISYILATDSATGASAAGTLKTGKPSDNELTATAMGEYYLDQKVALEFEETEAYQFYAWEVEGANVITAPAKNAESSFTVNNGTEAGSSITVNAIVYKRPQVNLDDLSPWKTPKDSYPKDEPVVLKFRHKIDSKAIDKITIDFTGENYVQKNYFKATAGDDGLTYTFNTIKYLELREDEAKEKVTVTIPSDVYYLAQDKRTQICASKDTDIVKEYWVNNTTKQMTSVNFQIPVTDASYSIGGVLHTTSQTKDFSKNETVDVVYNPSSADCKFNGWKLSPVDPDYTVSPSDFTKSGKIIVKKGTKTYITLTIDSTNPAHATMTFNDYISASGEYGMRLLTRQYQMPLVTKFETVTSRENKNIVECDSPLRILFNKKMDFGSLQLYDSESHGSIQIVSAANTDVHYEENFTLNISDPDKKIVRIEPNDNIYNLLGSQKSLDLKVILDKQNIRDYESYSLEGNNEWTYRIDQETKKKTKVSFTIDNAYTNQATVKVNNSDTDVVKNWSIGKEFQIECVPNAANGYAVSGWTIVSGSQYIEIEDNEAAKTWVTVKKGEEEPYPEVIISPDVYQKLSFTYAPKYKKTGVECNTPIIITFNKEMNTSSLSLNYEKEDGNVEEGTVHIVSSLNQNLDYGEYFYPIDADSWNTEKTILTINAKDTITELFKGAATVDLKVILDTDQIFDTEHKQITGASEWIYSINPQTTEKTKIKFVLDTKYQSDLTIKVNGGSVNIGSDEYKYAFGTSYELDCAQITDNYALSSWTINGGTTSDYISITPDVNGKYKLNINKAKGENAEAEVVKANVYLVPKVDTQATQLYTKEGVNWDSDIVITFNKAINSSTLNSFNNIGIYNGLDSCNEYFKTPVVSSETVDGTKITKVTISHITPVKTTGLLKVFGNDSLKDLTVKLDGDGIKDLSGHSLKGTTSFTYRINRQAVSKSYFRLGIIDLDTGSQLSNNSKIYLDDVAKQALLSVFVGNVNKLEYRGLTEGYAFYMWDTIAQSSSSRFDYFTIGDKYSAETTLVVTEAVPISGLCNMQAKIYLVPKVVTESIYEDEGSPYNKPIKIEANKGILSSTLSLYNPSTKTGSIKITDINNSDKHYENCFEKVELDTDLKTIVITPKPADVFALLGTKAAGNYIEEKEFMITLDQSLITDATSYEFNLTGRNEFPYKINRKSYNKTGIQFDSNNTNCSVTVDGIGVTHGTVKESSLRQILEIEAVPNENYGFDKWEVSTTASPVNIAIGNEKSIKTTLTVNSISDKTYTVKPKSYLIAKPTTGTDDLFNTEGYEFNKPIEIKFNKELDSDTVRLYSSSRPASIRIVNPYNTNENFERFIRDYDLDEYTEEIDGVEVTKSKIKIILDDEIYSSIGSEGTKDLLIVLDQSIIKDTEGHLIAGISSYNYRINKKSYYKTNVKFAISNCKVHKLNSLGQRNGEINNNASVPYNCFEEFDVECEPNSGYDFDSWTYTASDSDFVEVTKLTDHTARVRILQWSNPEVTVTITPSCYTIPVVSTAPLYEEGGLPFDDAISISFNVGMVRKNGSSTADLSLYNKNTGAGVIQIVDTTPNENHIEDKFYISSISDDKKTIKIMPHNSVLEWIDSSEYNQVVKTKEFKIKLDSNNIVTNDTKKHSLTGENEWLYNISNKSHYPTKIAVEIFDEDRGNCFVRIGGVEIDANRYYDYYRGQKLNVECICTNEEYIFDHWELYSEEDDWVELIDEDLFDWDTNGSCISVITESDVSGATLTINPYLRQRPVVIDILSSPDLLNSGVNMDTPIELIFNKEMDPSTISIWNESTNPSGTIKIYDENNHNVGNYFKQSPLANNGKKLIIHPDGSIIDNMLGNKPKLTITVTLTGGISEAYDGSGDEALDLSNRYGSTGYVKTVCYNKSRDTTLPSLNTVDFYSSINHEKNGLRCFWFSDFDEYFAGMIKSGSNKSILYGSTMNQLSVHAKYAWIDCKAYDYGSGIKSIVVTETLKQTKEGVLCNTVYPSREIDIGAFTEIETNLYEGQGRYDFISSDDGWVDIEVRAKNYTGSISPQSYTMRFYKDTSVDVSDYYLTNALTLTGSSSNAEVVDSYKKNIETVPTGSEENPVNNTAIFSLTDYNSTDMLFVYSNTEKWGLTPTNLNYDFTCPISVDYYYSTDKINWNVLSKGISKKVGGITYQLLDCSPVFSSTQTTFVKVVVKDEPGNEDEKIYCIPRKYEVTNWQTTPTTSTGDYIYVTFDNTDDIYPEYDYKNYLLLTYYPGNATYTDYVTRPRNSETYLNCFDKGSTSRRIYTVKGLSYISKGGTNAVIYGLTGEPAVYTVPSTSNGFTITNTTNVKITNNSTITSSGFGTGTVKVHLEIDITNLLAAYQSSVSSDIDVDKINFSVIAGSDSSQALYNSGEYIPNLTFTKKSNGIFTTDFVMPSYRYQNNKYLYTNCFNVGVNIRAIGVYKLFMSQNSSEFPFKIDNVPPVIKNVRFSDDYQCIIGDVQDVGYRDPTYFPSPFASDSSGNVPVEYWLIPYSNASEEQELRKLSMDTLITKGKKYNTSFKWTKTEANPKSESTESEKLIFPLIGVTEGDYLLVARFKDRQFSNAPSDVNTYFKIVDSFHCTVAEWTNYRLKITKDKNLATNLPYGTSSLDLVAGKQISRTAFDNNYSLVCVYEPFDAVNNTWSGICQSEAVSYLDATYVAPSRVIINYTEDEVNEGLFYRYYYVRKPKAGTLDQECVITNPAYIYTKASPSAYQKAVSLKNDYVAHIKYDEACLVETVSYSSDFGNTSEYKINLWEIYGKKSNAQIFKGTKEEDYFVDLTQTDPGDYYCVLVHFEDGTTMISEVAQKPW